MNRDELKELGLSEEQIESVMSSHGKSINSTKEELSNAQSEKETLKEQLTERDTQLEGLRGKAQGNDEMQSTIDALKEANNEAKKAYEKQLSDQKFGYELDRSLTGANAKNAKAVKALIDLDTVKLGEDGQIKGLQEQLESLKESDSYLFDSNESQTPNHNHTPGSNQKTNNPKPADDYQTARERARQLLKK